MKKVKVTLSGGKSKQQQIKVKASPSIGKPATKEFTSGEDALQYILEIVNQEIELSSAKIPVSVSKNQKQLPHQTCSETDKKQEVTLMNDQKWLDGYSGQSVDHLIALQGEYRTDSIVLAFEQAVDQKAAKIGSDKISEVERTILAIEALEREVNNGGYCQLFINSSKEYASVLVHSLKAIGCARTAEITTRAIDALKINGTLSVDAIDKVMNEENETRNEILSECDNQYYDAGEDIATQLFEYIKSNKSQIKLR